MLGAEIAAIVAAGTAAAIAVDTLGRRLPSGPAIFAASLGRPERGPRVATQLVRLEQIVGWSSSSALEAHTRLRPVLVEVAEARLQRRGLRLDRDAAEAERLLGPAAWDLVRPDRPLPRDPDGPGVRNLPAILDALEAL